MYKAILCIVVALLASTINKSTHSDYNSLEKNIQSSYVNPSEFTSKDNKATGEYIKYIRVPATKYMPELLFELTGDCKKEDSNSNYYYYPVELVIKTNKSIIQKIDFNEDDFAPCEDDDFSFEYGDYKFDGYGGFRLLHTSMGQNPDFFFWMWDKEKQQFVQYPDLDIIGIMTFDYKKKEVHVASRASATYHEFDTYEYINNKLTLVEKIIDQDRDGYRRVYKLINGKMKLVETTESQLMG